MIAETSAEFVGHIVQNTTRLMGDLRRDGAEFARQAESLYILAARCTRDVHDTARAAPRVTRIVTEGLRIAARRAAERHLRRALAKIDFEPDRAQLMESASQDVRDAVRDAVKRSDTEDDAPKMDNDTDTT